ncbi:MAG: energy-coupling factor transporter transmembrane protein EcfT [Firmicutes bacterium]|nr:energy-coupling factor transporter transmembrane protein EcfT [Bacillota bacterium]
MAQFQYQAHDTPIHRVHPIIKLAFLIMLALISGYIVDPLWKLPMLILVIVVAKIARLPFREYKGLLVIVAVMTFLSQFYMAFFVVDPAYFKVYPQEIVSRVIFQITPQGFPVIGETALTVGSFIWLTKLPLTAVTLLLLIATFLHTTSLNEIVQALSILKAPYPVVYITMLAFRFTPDLTRQMHIIQTAQKLRGWSVDTRNPVKLIRLYTPLLIPLGKYVMNSIDVMTISVQNRAFGAGPVTGMRSVSLRSSEKAILAAGVVIFGVLLYGIIALNWGNL